MGTVLKPASFALLVAVLLLGAPLAATAQPIVTLTVGDANAAEAAQNTGSFTVFRTDDGNTAAPLNVWLTIGGPATEASGYTVPDMEWIGGADYRGTIAGGQLSRTMVLTPVLDVFNEGDETFMATIRLPGDSGHQYTIGLPSAGIITIHDFVQGIFKDSFEEL